jgi:hypothetical protein
VARKTLISKELFLKNEPEMTKNAPKKLQYLKQFFPISDKPLNG